MLEKTNSTTANDIEQLINEKKTILSMNRATGRTYRRANDIIEKFFNSPMGTKIYIQDHYYGTNYGVFKSDKNTMPMIVADKHGHPLYENSKANRMLADLINKRIHNDFPLVKFEIIEQNFENASNIFIVRKSMTVKEKLEKEIRELEENLANSDQYYG